MHTLPWCAPAAASLHTSQALRTRPQRSPAPPAHPCALWRAARPSFSAHKLTGVARALRALAADRAQHTLQYLHDLDHYCHVSDARSPNRIASACSKHAGHHCCLIVAAKGCCRHPQDLEVRPTRWMEDTPGRPDEHGQLLLRVAGRKAAAITRRRRRPQPRRRRRCARGRLA